ncbi:MAG TPA: PAS domain S-box protein [Anaerolineaceae bacterium]|nr:PAS domain S-box protein [Anaerolineaceae bacterium]HPN54172.1 PAS domain S-box protein [Anaerolineaceae bacterium]
METDFSAANSTIRVVVVNDDCTQLNLLCGLLKKIDIIPAAFHNVESALADMLQNATSPDLIITDLYMPGIDGWRFCRLLRSPEYQAFNHVPILVVSATYSGEDPSSMTANLGADAFLSMPVDGKIFTETVLTLIKHEEPEEWARVLVVENDESLAAMLSDTFQAHGFRADSAQTLQEAFAKISQMVVFDVAVIDEFLPDGQGDALLGDLKAAFPDCVCVMITDGSQTTQALAWMKKGAMDYIHKPFEPEYLVSKCERGRREQSLLRIQDLLKERTRQLRQSEERFRNAISATSDGLWDWDIASGEVFYSPAYFEMLGYSPAEFPPTVETWENLVHPDDLQRVKNANQACICGLANEVSEEFRMRARDGSWHWILGRGHAVRRDAQGIALQLIGTHVDITAHKRAEEALRISEERFHKLSDDIPVCICSFLPDGSIVYVNAVQAELTGTSPDQLIGKKIFDLLPPQNLELVKKGLDALTPEQPIEIHEQIHILPDGSQRMIEWRNRAFFDVNGRVSHLLGVGVDITERRRMDDARRLSEERFAIAFHISPDSININRLVDGLYLDINAGFTALTGFTREDVIGKTSLEINIWSNPEDRARLVKGLREKGEVQNLEAPFRTKNGEIKICLMSARVIEVNHEPCILSITRDITERKKAEEALRKSEELLNETQHLTRVGGWEWNVITQTMTWSDEAYNIHGLPAPKFQDGSANLIQNSLACYDPAYRSVIEQAFHRCVNEGIPYQVELPFTSVKGEKKWIQTIGKAEYKDGQIVRVSGYLMDITERKHAEQALRESEEKFRLIVENQRDLLVKTDIEGHLLFVNPVYCDTFGKTEAELIGSTYMPMVHPDDLPVVEKAVARLFSPPYQCEYEERAKTCQGWRWFSWIARAILDENGNVTALIGSGRDITDRKEAEVKINDQLAELRRWQNVMLGRESRIMELKREVNALLTEANQPPRYPSVEKNTPE